MNYAARFFRLGIGLVLCTMGIYLIIQANIGLAPWDAFSMGISNLTGVTYGNIVILTGLVILLFVILLKEHIGVGTIIDVLVFGKLVDFFRAIDLVPMQENFFIGIVLLLFGQVLVCVGSYFYIGAALSCGPRDALMVGLAKKFHKIPVGIIRGIIEGSALLIGWSLGAKIGIGTVIFVFGMGFVMQLTFKLLNFDVRAVEHESLTCTYNITKNNLQHTNDNEIITPIEDASSTVESLN